MAAAPGSAGNVLAALCSFFAPGLGQLLQGRLLAALLHFLAAVVIWVVTFGFGGWIMHVISAFEAAIYKTKHSMG